MLLQRTLVLLKAEPEQHCFVSFPSRDYPT